MDVSERLEIAGADGVRLAARLHRTPGEVRAWALFAHCFTCGKDVRAAVRICAALAERGIATLRFDFTGLGESEGDFAETSFCSNVNDLAEVARYMERKLGPPRLLIGHSLGGAAVIAAASRIESAVAVATIGAPFDPAHIRHLIAPATDEIRKRGEAEVTIAGRSFRLRRQFIDDLEAQDPAATLRSLRRALLILHAPADQVVGIDNARLIFEAARHPKSFVSLDGADHLLSSRDRADAVFAGQLIAAWAERYLPEPASPPHDHTEVVVEGGPRGLAQRVQVGHHTLAADEPEDVGGTDTGLAPYDLLLAALGACTSMTLRLYADRKGWPLQGVRVAMSHGRVHARDCADCESEGGQISEVNRRLELRGPLDESQRARLLEIADRCPVHRTLTGEIKIRTHLALRAAGDGPDPTPPRA